MPRPSGPPLLVACYDGRVADVRALLASGADPRDVPSPRSHSCIFSCVHFGYASVLEVLLATGQYELVHQVQNVIPRSAGRESAPPLMYLLWHWAQPNRGPLSRGHQLNRSGSDPLECVRLLLDAGASLAAFEAAEAPRYGAGSEMLRHDVFEYARQIGNADLLRMLEAAARLRYSPATHGRFPRPARYAAAELLRLGYQIESGILAPVWAEHVLPLLVSRTSRGAAPPVSLKVLFIDALDDGQVEAMLTSDDAAERAAATLERSRRIIRALKAE